MISSSDMISSYHLTLKVGLRELLIDRTEIHHGTTFLLRHISLREMDLITVLLQYSLPDCRCRGYHCCAVHGVHVLAHALITITGITVIPIPAL